MDNKMGDGLSVGRYFTREGISHKEMFAYERRTSIIKNPDGSIVFEMNDVEVPEFWSQVATDILAQKYLRKAGVPLRNEKGDLLLDENGKVITGRETSIRQVAHRLAGCWRHWGDKFGYFSTPKDAENYYEEMAYMIIAQIAAPNSPQWFTTGLNWAYGLTGPAQGHCYVDPVTKKLEYSKDAYTRSQPHACFIQEIEDDLVRDNGIFSLLLREARVFKYGSGTGSNFSRLRGRGESLSGGGYSSGLMSFLKIFDAAAGSIKSGGTTRRAAKMVCLDLDHPEVEEFIWWKVKEEEKVADLVAGSRIMKKKLSRLVEAAKGKENVFADPQVRDNLLDAYRSDIPLNYLVRALDLARQGYDLPVQEFNTHYESEAYQTVSGQNSNNSLRIPNSFFKALERNSKWDLHDRVTGKTLKSVSSEKLWNDIGYCAWACADPGIQFDTTINEWHTCPAGGRINASNPCSEYHFLDDTACNLASINLLKFYDELSGKFDLQGYRHALRLWTITLEISVLMAHFPSEKIAEKSYQYRTLGLGYANLGTLLMLQGIPYDSDLARSIAGSLAAIMTGEAYATSAELASVLGPFERYSDNKDSMLKVIRNHRRAAYDFHDYESISVQPVALDQEICPPDLLEAAHQAWDRALELGERYGYRNAQTTVIAPTGTIGLVLDCDTTGIEPDYALVKYKKLAGGGYFKIVNSSVPAVLSRLGYSRSQVKDILSYCLGVGSLVESPFVNQHTLLEKGLSSDQVSVVEKELRKAMDLNSIFNPWTLGASFYQEIMSKGKNSFLLNLGFKEEEISLANECICGTMSLESAPYLKEEHYPIFDCANKCGAKGSRYIHPYGHLKMVSAVQPFISGAISKTINMPSEWTVEQIKQAYLDSWKMMIKGVALYRDGCKLSQPLNTSLESNGKLKGLLEEAAKEESSLEDSAGSIGPSFSLPSQIRIIKKVKVGSREVSFQGTLQGGLISGLELKMDWPTPLQQVTMKALLNVINCGLSQGLDPICLAESSLRVDGNPLINELRSFLIELSAEVKESAVCSTSSFQQSSFQQSSFKVMPTVSVVPSSIIVSSASLLSSSSNETERCRGCGATKLRRNGTCMLCEVCGDTTGCS
jgi:ribonucleoside-diphosphate reductase alpha chain